MNGVGDLVTVHGDRAVTTSLIVADRFGKKHGHVLEAISKSQASDEFARSNFRPGDYLDANGQRRPMVEMTRDGAMFLIMGFTGPEAARWKERFIAAFNEAERRLVAAPTVEALGEKLLDLRPAWWREVRDLTAAGKTIARIAQAVGMSHTTVYRTQVRLQDLGLLEHGHRYRRALENRLVKARRRREGEAFEDRGDPGPNAGGRA